MRKLILAEGVGFQRQHRNKVFTSVLHRCGLYCRSNLRIHDSKRKKHMFHGQFRNAHRQWMAIIARGLNPRVSSKRMDIEGNSRTSLPSLELSFTGKNDARNIAMSTIVCNRKKYSCIQLKPSHHWNFILLPLYKFREYLEFLGWYWAETLTQLFSSFCNFWIKLVHNVKFTFLTAYHLTWWGHWYHYRKILCMSTRQERVSRSRCKICLKTQATRLFCVASPNSFQELFVAP